MSASDASLEIVISYAHRDQELKDDLILHLSPLRRQGFIAAWHDRDINAGDDWKRAIDIHFNAAGMILLLVSPDFIASDYCYEIEMKRALERHDAGECRVIPVFLRACDWKGLPFGRLQGLPDDAIPVVSAQWPSRDDAFLRVARGIRRVVEKWRTEKTPVAASVADTPRTIAPKLWVDSSGDLVKFLRFARLSAVFWLKKTNTCQAILELCLGPIVGLQLHVRFRGRREKDWSGKSISIAVEGDCPLELMSAV